MRYWTCPHGHIIGVIVERPRRRDRLFLVYPALEPETAKEFNITGEAHGGYTAVCSICKVKMHWNYQTKAPVHAGAI